MSLKTFSPLGESYQALWFVQRVHLLRMIFVRGSGGIVPPMAVDIPHCFSILHHRVGCFKFAPLCVNSITYKKPRLVG